MLRPFLFAILGGFVVAAPLWAQVEKIRVLDHSEGVPRRSEGDFMPLADGRLLFIYTKFVGGRADHAEAVLASRESRDGGRTWSTDDVVLIEKEAAQNVMSVSLNRLADGRIAFFYLRKNSMHDCRPVVRFSSDEAKSWSEAVQIVPESEIGCYVVNNDRVVQLKSGRLIVPCSQHISKPNGPFEGRGVQVCYLSDDGGRTWRRGRGSQDGTQPDGKRIVLQEPGIVERRDGSLLMFCRTTARSQYFSESNDGGETWTVPQPSPLKSPLSPASIERIPSTGDLLCVWNDHGDLPPGSKLADKRTPLRATISRDDGRTWQPSRTLEDNVDGWFCYTAVEFVGDDVLLAYCASDLKTSERLADTQFTRFPVQWLYESPR